MNCESNYELSRVALVRLLGVAVEAESSSGSDARAQAAADLLDACLRAPLPVGPPTPQQLPALLYPLAQRMGLRDSASLGDLLVDPHTPLCVLTTIKDHGKQLAAVRADGPLHTVGVALYFAAIAAALSHHDTRVSSYSRARLAGAFERFAGADWLPRDLAGLFARARSAATGQADDPADEALDPRDAGPEPPGDEPAADCDTPPR